MDVVARILLRYGAGFLVAKGLLFPDMGAALEKDPEMLAWVQIGLGVALGAASEAWYWLAKRLGWKT